MAPESANGRGKTAVLHITPETGRLPDEMCTLAVYISGKSGGLGDVVAALCVGLTPGKERSFPQENTGNQGRAGKKDHDGGAGETQPETDD